MKLVKTTDAVGCILCHDVTRIIPNEVKGPAFKKGHKIQREDIDKLRDLGKENLYVWEDLPGLLHENQGAEILRDLCMNAHMTAGEPSEGKIEIFAQRDGLLKIDRQLLKGVNGYGQMMIASRYGDFPIRAGDKLAGMRIIPLVIEQEKMESVQKMCGDNKIFKLLPFEKRTAAVITTGSEVYHRRIEDGFTPVVIEKLGAYGCEVTRHEIVDDNPEAITEAILRNAPHTDLVICTGGMSVDPDDRTPLAIKNTGAEVISYGAPVLPGAMFLLSYLEGKPVVGLPGCVMYAKRTIFDLVLPRLLVGDIVKSEELAALGEGGLCLSCMECVFPNCGFGKGR